MKIAINLQWAAHCLINVFSSFFFFKREFTERRLFLTPLFFILSKWQKKNVFEIDEQNSIFFFFPSRVDVLVREYVSYSVLLLLLLLLLISKTTKKIRRNFLHVYWLCRFCEGLFSFVFFFFYFIENNPTTFRRDKPSSFNHISISNMLYFIATPINRNKHKFWTNYLRFYFIRIMALYNV